MDHENKKMAVKKKTFKAEFLRKFLPELDE